MRDQRIVFSQAPDFASLHPGYAFGLFTCSCANPAVLA